MLLKSGAKVQKNIESTSLRIFKRTLRLSYKVGIKCMLTYLNLNLRPKNNRLSRYVESLLYKTIHIHNSILRSLFGDIPSQSGIKNSY